MFLSRLSKLKIVLAVLLPYMVLAIGSGFLHNHGVENGTCAAIFSLTKHADEGGGAGLGKIHSVSSHHSECPACSWARNNLSGCQTVSTVDHTSTITAFVASECLPHSTGCTRLAPSRAPPFS